MSAGQIDIQVEDSETGTKYMVTVVGVHLNFMRCEERRFGAWAGRELTCAIPKLFDDEEALSAEMIALRKRLRFYESVMTGPPHKHDGRPCKIAEAKGLICCNPSCKGEWGTNCWCCHHLPFARDASAEEIDLYLELHGPR